MSVEAPRKIDLSEGSGPWPRFVVSGVTSLTAMNGSYAVSFQTGDPVWSKSGSPVIEIAGELGDWTWSHAGVAQFHSTGHWPWSGTWTVAGTAGGTPVLTGAAGVPDKVTLTSPDSATAATLTTNLTGTNNDLTYTSKLPGRLGNDVTVRYVAPAAANAVLSVAVSGRDITVNLATNASSVVTSTATQVKSAIDGHAGAAALVAVANSAANNGSAAVTAMAATALAGGTGGLPLPPVMVTI